MIERVVLGEVFEVAAGMRRELRKKRLGKHQIRGLDGVHQQAEHLALNGGRNDLGRRQRLALDDDVVEHAADVAQARFDGPAVVQIGHPQPHVAQRADGLTRSENGRDHNDPA